MAAASPLTDMSTPAGWPLGAVGDSPSASASSEKNHEKKGGLSPEVRERIRKATEGTGERPESTGPNGAPLKFPELEPLPPPPKQESTSPLEAWGSLAMLAAALGGARSRTHATTALNAAAEALKGFHQHDQETYKNKVEEWRISAENANRIQNYEVETYKAIMERRDKDWLNQLHAQSISNQNKNIESLIHSRDEKGLTDYIRAMTQATKAGDKATQDQDVKFIADGIESGKLPPTLTGLYRNKAAIEAELGRRGVDLSARQLEFKGAEREVSSLNGPQMTRFKSLAVSVVNSIDEVKRLSQQMELSGVPFLNKKELEYYTQTQGNTPNGQLAARYLAAINTVKEEFASLVTGGYAPHTAAFDLANRQINADYGVKELGAALDEVQQLINYRVRAVNDRGLGSNNRYLKGGGEENAPTEGAKEPNAAQGEMPEPKTPEDADKLAPGTKFRLPDGTIGVVPGG
jgi:hypothetical protein